MSCSRLENRFIHTPDGEPGLNYLCAGYKAFFNHVDQPMKTMAMLISMRRHPAEIMKLLVQSEPTVDPKTMSQPPAQKKKRRRSRRSGKA